MNLSRGLQARLGRGFGRANLFQMKAFVLGDNPDRVWTFSDGGRADGCRRAAQAARRTFLDRMIAPGDEIIVSTPVKNVTEATG